MGRLLDLFALQRKPSGVVSANYANKVLSYSPIAYWQLNELVGSVANDSSGNDYHGSIVGCTLGQPGIGDGQTSFLFDGINDLVTLPAVALNADFDGDEGTMMVWTRVFNLGVWTE